MTKLRLLHSLELICGKELTIIFRNDNAPVLQIETEERFFSFIVKTDFKESHHRFDQCGVVMYLDSENWLKGSIEYEE